MTTSSARLEFRVRPDRKSRIERAAQLTGESVGEFARSAAEEKAEQILREHEATTTVPAEFFNELWDSLGSAPTPHPALARAGREATAILTRE